MPRALALACLLATACAPAPHPFRVELVHQATVDAHLRALLLMSDRTLLAAGFEGRAACSTDAGATWRAIPTGTSLHLYGAALSPQGDVWLVGERGLVLHAEDRALVFRAEPTPARERLTAACAEASRRVTAVGDGGIVLERGADGPWSIRVPSRPGVAGLRAVALLADRRFATGYDGLALVEAPAGSWQVVPMPGGGDAIYGLGAGPDGRLWSCGSFGSLQATEDGQTWTAVSSGTRAFLRGIAFHGELGVAVGLGTVVVTTDGGRSWSPSLEGHPAQLLAAAAMPGGSAIAAGEDGTIVRTTDAGSSWSEVTHRSGSGAAIAWPSPGTVLVAAGTVLRSTDGGRTFRGIDGPTAERLSMWDEERGLALDRSGRLLLTEDGGATWRGEPAAPGKLSRIACIDATSVVAAGDGGIFWSPDGGASWTPGRAPSAPLRHLAAGDAEAPAWIAGEDGLLGSCRKAGGPWLGLYTGLHGVTLESVARAGDHLYAVGESGVALSSSREGRGSSLSLRRLPGAPHLRAVATSPDEPAIAVAVGDGGTACITIDGGHRWRCQSVHPTLRLTDVAVRGRVAIAVGEGARIYRLSF